MNGLITLAVGEKYVERAAALAMSANRFDVPTILMCPERVTSEFSHLFLKVVKLNTGLPRTPEDIWQLKKLCYENSKHFDYCAFVDADSLVIRNPVSMFGLADRSGIHTPSMRRFCNNEGWQWNTPNGISVRDIARNVGVNECDPLYSLNGGFLVWRRCATASRWFSDFSDMFQHVDGYFSQILGKRRRVRDELCMSLSFAVQGIELHASDSSMTLWGSSGLSLDIEHEVFQLTKRSGNVFHTFSPYIAHFSGGRISGHYRNCVRFLCSIQDHPITLPLFL